MESDYSRMMNSGDDLETTKYGPMRDDDESSSHVHLPNGSSPSSSSSSTSFYEQYVQPHLNKGFLSNLFTFVMMVIGFIIVIVSDSKGDKSHAVIGDYVLAFGLFGFMGGFTNWIAIKMLFDKIPGLYGSGIIPLRFKEIREVVKNVIMKTFFDEAYLRRYASQKIGQLAGSMNIEDKIKKLLESPQIDAVIELKLGELASRPEGMVLAMMGLAPSQLKPMVKPFVVGMGSDVAPLLMDALVGPGGSSLNIAMLRQEVDKLMTEKLEELSPEIVKKLLEEVMREHLGWLVVWGNIFGSILGVLFQILSQATGINF
eukprot:ANDGO_06017.mRNA.1 hypothetical protein AMSG_06634